MFRLFSILFWVFVILQLVAVGQNIRLEVGVFDNHVFIAMGITVILVFLDEITKSLSSKSRIKEELDKTFEKRVLGEVERRVKEAL